MCLGKNVSLRRSTIYIIEDYMEVTGKGFSKTLNRIIYEWDVLKAENKRMKEREEKFKREKYYPSNFNKEESDVKN